jgi:hypothetical protein
MSLLIISVIMVGLQSAIMIAGRSAPGANNGRLYCVSAGQGMDQLQADLSTATAFTAMTATSATFTVPDRNGDGNPETIQYSWDGVSGDGLQRTINGGTAVTVAPKVTEFALTYDKKSVVQPTTYTQSAEQVLSSFPTLNPLLVANGDVSGTNGIGEIFAPSLPGNAVKWNITRVQYIAKAKGPALGYTRVQLRAVNGSTIGLVCDETMLPESSLGTSYAWTESDFSGNYQFSPTTSVALTFQWYSDADSCNIEYQSLLAVDLNAELIQTSNNGQSWGAGLTSDMAYYVYGTYFTVNPAVTNYYLNDVRCNLRSGSDSHRIHTTIPTLNQPQVTGP